MLLYNIMKFSHLLFLFIILLLPINSYSAEKRIIASIKPIHSILLNIVENEDVYLMIDGEYSPHDYQMKPSVMKKLQQSDIIFYIDDNALEIFLQRPLKTIKEDNKKISLGTNSRLKTYSIRESGTFKDEDSSDGHNHAHGEYDPHVWLDTENVIKISKQIVKELSKLNPSNKGVYKKNAIIFIEKLNKNKKRLKIELEAIKDEPYIVFHDAYQYFEKEFNLSPATSISINPGISPSPKRIKQIKSIISENNIKCVFKEPQFSSKVVQTIIKDTAAKEGILDPLGSNLESGKELYINLINDILPIL